jgi:glycosyltransferase involved in cell wall biosynthesis
VLPLIDGHMLGARETGNETYIRGLLSGLTAIGRHAAVYVAGERVDVGQHQAIVQTGRSDLARLLTGLSRAARDCRADVVHSTYIVPVRVPCARVVTVHDVSFLRHPELFTPRDRAVLGAGVRFSVRAAERVIVPSRHAKSEVCALLGVPDERIVVTPEGVDERFRPLEPAVVDPVLARLGISRPYVLAVGNLQPRKNLRRLLKAWAALAATGDHGACSLVVAGGFHGRRDDVAALSADPSSAGSVRFTGYVPDADLPALYGGAEVFVFPSLYEGFGLPVLEAMACGAAVACSETTSLPEVAGDAVAFFDPCDTGAIAATLGALLADARLRAGLRERGLRRAAHFTWAACARETVAAYEAAARGRGSA